MAWDVVSTHLNRCKEFGLNIDGDDLPPVQDLSFPILESFHPGRRLAAYDKDAYSWLSGPIAGAVNFKLTKVVLSSPHTSLPYSQLRTLKIRGLLENDLHSFLNYWSLEALHVLIRCEPSGEELPWPATFAMLPSLRRLKVWVDDPIYADTIIQPLLCSLVMPSLVRLQVIQNNWLGSDVLYFLTRRSSRLQRLELDTGGIANEINDSSIVQFAPLLSFLLNLPDLEYFTFRFSSAFLASSTLASAHISSMASALSDHFTTALSWLLERLSPHDDHSGTESKGTFLRKLHYIYLRSSKIALDPSLVHEFREVAVARAATTPLREMRLTSKNDTVRIISGPTTVPLGEQYDSDQC
ncbi:hypothetical protein AAF712_006112 [Marasmius tenuissimus]|uniref:Uncharacterized protein n=1 Tax=Marasmius tenuissimus TaxID=585030 RepID=A0ABR2ZYY3_9AGAR